MKIAVAIAALAAGLLAGAASAQQAGPHGFDRGDCFEMRNVESHTIGDERTIYLRTDRGVVYKVVAGNSCAAAALPNDPIVTVIRGVDLVCRPIDLDIRVHHMRCIASSITRMTPAEVAALPKRIRP